MRFAVVDPFLPRVNPCSPNPDTPKPLVENISGEFTDMVLDRRDNAHIDSEKLVVNEIGGKTILSSVASMSTE
jgi:hypothetical protein